MKHFFYALVVFAALVSALFVPIAGRSFWERSQEHGIPRGIARGTAHGLRAAFDFFASLSHRKDSPAAQSTHPTAPHSPRHASKKAQAASGQLALRPGREGIVPQPPKEKLQQSDRAALDDLVAKPR